MPKVAMGYVPKYRKHSSGQARVTIDGRDILLGPWKSKASLLEYDRIINEWTANGRRLSPDDAPQETTVSEVINAYWKFAKSYYGDTGNRRGVANNMKPTLALVRKYYGTTPAHEFGPKRLKALRHQLVEAGQSRTYVNRNIQIIRRMFKWAVAEEMVPAAVFQSLTAVEGLRKGRTKARETAPVQPVADGVVNATLDHLPATVADMVRFQRLTGARPGEVCILRPIDVDTSGDVWMYRPATHKTEHRGRQRVICIGPQGQDVLRPYLLRPAEVYCFSPRESEKRRRRLAHEARVTPLSCGNRPGTNRKPKPRVFSARYSNDTYRRAVHRAADKAGMPRWSPNQLRHTAATEIRKRYGLEAAQVTLGHAAADVTQIYAERDLQKAAAIMLEVG